MTAPRETDLYPVIKAFLEAQGYNVKGEVHDCDIMALRGDEDPIVIEIKTAFTLPLVFQGLRRKALTEMVYLAVPARAGKSGRSVWRKNYKDVIRLCRYLGLGLMAVHAEHGKRPPRVEVHLDPHPYRPRPNKARRDQMLREFQRRVGDPNPGGSTRRALVTAYRQDALRIARYLKRHGATRLACVRRDAGVERAAAILQRDVYGWFQRVERGIYALSPAGEAALGTFAEALQALDE